MNETEQTRQMREQRDTARRKAAASNVENDRLREEIRKLRRMNFMLQRNMDSRESETGYRVRYEKLAEALTMARDLLNPGVTGIPNLPPTTIEPFSTPDWARVKPKPSEDE